MGVDVKIYCVGCGDHVSPRLTNGLEIYPHREDLRELPFWKCDACGNYVGCHHKTRNPTKPLGNIPTKEIMDARMKIHALIDPVWKSGKMPRGKLYAKLSKLLGYHYHTGEIASIEQARDVYRAARKVIS
jgi:hypothetical protein